MLLDFIRPTEGTVTVLGSDAQTETQTVHERVGVLPEGYSLYDRLTGREHLRLAGRLNGCSVDIAAVCDRVGLDPADAERPAGTYSTGMGQRLALGMATVGEPDLLIFDEPTSGLDPHGVSLLKRLVRAEADRGTTVFFSSHILDHVEAVCDRVGILDSGRLIAVDTVEGLREAASAELPAVSASGAELAAELTLEDLFELYTTGTDADRRAPAAAGGEL